VALLDIQQEARTECLIFDKAPTASVSNGLKNNPSDEFIGEIIIKINVA
jgi:hypothetical protein